jgi:dipeptidyl aminopeptidase/acylaminoacyl peptidase/tRNA A-37 threonylcarbamoyl transferase component Bud32
MGEVYKARDPRLDRFVAIKVLPTAFAKDADRLARFEREAKAVAALSHPNILAIFDVGAHDGQTYAVMELLDGESLRERLLQGPLSVRKATECAIQVTRGLAAAHDKGVVHRDLKPDNIFLLPDGRVKILDFGLARTVAGAERPTDSATEEATVLSPRTDAGTVMGTVGYMAPEQVRGQTVDGRADLFALGTVLYEMLAGRRAFERDTAADTMTAILKEDPPEFDRGRGDIPPSLDRIIRHCLEKNVVERFQSARDVAFALESLSGSAPVLVAAATGSVSAPIARRNRRGLGMAIAALLIVAAAAAGGFAGRATAPKAAPAPRFTMKTFEPQTIVNARFMPDGNGIVFSSALTGNAVRLFHIQAGLTEARPFGPALTHLLSVSSKGELAVLTNVSLIGQRLFKGTLARMTVEGSPRPWMEDVREADWSPDGTTLAIVHDQGSRDRLEYPIGTVLYETAGYVSDPRVSPDGMRVAFMDHQSRFDNRGWVKVVDRDKNVTTLAGEFYGEEGLAWSPDGTIVLFAANDHRAAGDKQTGDLSYQIHSVAFAKPESPSSFTTPGDFTIYDVASDGRWLASREDIRLGVGARLQGNSVDRDLSWLNQSWTARLSHDGTRLLFSDGTAGANYGVGWRPTDGSPIVRLGDGNNIDWSPDERWVLAQLFQPPQLLLYPMGAGEPVRLKRGTIAEYQIALWFPDGKRLLVMGNEAGKPTRAFQQDVPDGEPKPVLEAGIFPAAIARDGKTVLAINGEGKWRWYPLSGEPSQPAPGFEDTDDPTSMVGWSTDGKELFVHSGTTVPSRIDRVTIATGQRTLLAEAGPVDRTGLFMFTPSSVSKDGAQYAYSYMKRLSTLFVVTPAR